MMVPSTTPVQENAPQTLDDLRELFLHAPESLATQILAVIGSTALLVLVALLVRRRSLREEYTPIWVCVALAIALVSLRLDLLRSVARAIGAWTPSSTIFFLGEVFLVLICLNYAVRLSRHGSQLKNLAQEAAILRAEVERLSRGRDGDGADE